MEIEEQKLELLYQHIPTVTYEQIEKVVAKIKALQPPPKKSLFRRLVS